MFSTSQFMLKINENFHTSLRTGRYSQVNKHDGDKFSTDNPELPANYFLSFTSQELVMCVMWLAEPRMARPS
jgi:hypothetical protein